MASQERSREAGSGTPGGSRADKSAADPAASEPGEGAGKPDNPDWSHGLRQLYDSVVEEELPDNFRALLDKLDDTDPGEIDDKSETHDTTPSRRGTASSTNSSKGGGA